MCERKGSLLAMDGIYLEVLLSESWEFFIVLQQSSSS